MDYHLKNEILQIHSCCIIIESTPFESKDTQQFGGKQHFADEARTDTHIFGIFFSSSPARPGHAWIIAPPNIIVPPPPRGIAVR